MNEILENIKIAPMVFRMNVISPEIAKKRKPGQFVIIRPKNYSERIPLTIADSDPQDRYITLIYQIVGKTTHELSLMKKGENINDIVGPMGKPSHIENFGNVVCVGGGIGIAPLYPIVDGLKKAGNSVISILGARGKDLLILEDEMRRVSDEVIITTDDGSYGEKGFVTHALEKIIKSGLKINIIFAIGPAIMMKMVSKLTQNYGIPTIVSLNTIMIDGTGMCGGCRVQVGGEAKFVCVDGPEFDGHKVDFDEMLQRLQTYVSYEKQSYELFLKKCALENIK